MGNTVDTAFRTGVDSYNGKSYPDAFRQFKGLEEQSHAEGIYMLGVMAYYGEGCEKDMKEAYEKFQKAHLLNESKATFRLGMMLMKGEGVAKDMTEGDRYLKEAYAKGFMDPQKEYSKWLSDAAYGNELFVIGEIFYGQNDMKQAFEKFEKASGLSDLRATFRVGMMLVKGEGVERNEKEAVKYLNLARDGGVSHAAFELGIIAFFGGGVGEKDHGLAKGYLEEAYAKGHVEAGYQLGFMCSNGFGFERDLRLARKYLEESYEKGFLESAFHIGCVLVAIGDPIDEKKAVTYLLEAGDAESYELLGDIYMKLHLRNREKAHVDEAFKYYLESYERGNKNLAFCIAEMYQSGLGVKKDTMLAKKFFEEALTTNHRIAAAQQLYILCRGEEYLTLIENSNEIGPLKFAGEVYLSIDRKKALKCFSKCAEFEDLESLKQVWAMYYTTDIDYEKSFYWYVKLQQLCKTPYDKYCQQLNFYFARNVELSEKLYTIYVEAFRNQLIDNECYYKLLLGLPVKFYVDKFVCSV